MKKMFVVYAVLMLSYMINADAQNLKKDNVQRYIERYRSLAMSEQQRTGMPAAIKLAQGIHETGAGSSKLATEANNHFGLKCKNDWRGATYKYTDDAPNECFRKYNLDFESYQDQSNYLKGNPRYASLFSLSVTDYAAWAFGLHKAGYATNPKYPLLLIKIIEDYKLQEYTYAAMGGPENIADNVAVAPAENTAQPSRSRRAATQTYTQETPAQETPRQRSAQPSYGYQSTTTPIDNTPPERVSKYLDTRPQERQTITRSNQNGRTVEQPVERPNTIVKMNNLKAVYGTKGDMPLQYAVRNGIRYEKFLEMNDLEDKPLAADMPLYLERKHFWGIRPMHLVKFGETMHMIAQKEGIQLKYLRDLNYIEEDEEPVPGSTLELQAQAGTKPQVEKRKEEAVANTQQNTYRDNSQNSSEAYSNPRYSGGNNNYEADNAQSSKYYQGNSYQDNAQQQYAAPPVSTFPKNPAPPYQEEKPLWEKMKETRLARKLQKEYEAIAPQQQYTQPQAQQPVQQSASTKAVYKPNPAAQVQNELPAREPKRKEKNIEPIAQQQEIQQQPAQQPTNSRVTYKPNPAARLQYEQPANEPPQQQYQQPVAQQPQYQQPAAQQQQYQQPATQQPVARQPEQSYRSQQYSYSTTNTPVKTNPAAEVAEEKPARESKRRGKNKEVAAPQPVAKPQSQRPKTELDLLKEQFDNVIYAQNTPPAKSQPQQPRQQSYQQQTQPAYQQPAQQTYQQPVQREDAYAQQPVAQQTQQQEERVDPSKLYTVQNGDTAYTIAKRHGITIRQLMDWNGLDFDAIKEGQTLRVKP